MKKKHILELPNPENEKYLTDCILYPMILPNIIISVFIVLLSIYTLSALSKSHQSRHAVLINDTSKSDIGIIKYEEVDTTHHTKRLTNPLRRRKNHALEPFRKELLMSQNQTIYTINPEKTKLTVQYPNGTLAIYGNIRDPGEKMRRLIVASMGSDWTDADRESIAKIDLPQRRYKNRRRGRPTNCTQHDYSGLDQYLKQMQLQLGKMEEYLKNH